MQMTRLRAVLLSWWNSNSIWAQIWKFQMIIIIRKCHALSVEIDAQHNILNRGISPFRNRIVLVLTKYINRISNYFFKSLFLFQMFSNNRSNCFEVQSWEPTMHIDDFQFILSIMRNQFMFLPSITTVSCTFPFFYKTLSNLKYSAVARAYYIHTFFYTIRKLQHVFSLLQKDLHLVALKPDKTQLSQTTSSI